MFIKKIIAIVVATALVFPLLSFSYCQITSTDTLNNIINQLGWVQTNEGRCGGYYLEQPFNYPENLLKNKLIITSDQYLFARHGTSIGQGRVTITRFGQEIIANRAYLYRDPETGQYSAIELVDNISLREPNSLIVANHGRFDFRSKMGFLNNILYRTAIYSNPDRVTPVYTAKELQQYRQINQLSAWGGANSFHQDQPKIYQFEDASYSTCPPTICTWQVKAKHICLNKETGRGSATHVRLLVKGVPVFYTPYLNFPIDSRRKTGFLWPTVGTRSTLGPFISTPFYWNMAPNYDMTITPEFIKERGILFIDLFRYLTQNSSGNIKAEVIPNDKKFREFQNSESDKLKNNPSPITQSELRRLLHASDDRNAFSLQHKTRFNDHWSGDIDYSYVSDDYYLKDFSNNFNQVTQNQLLQQGELLYKSLNWNFLGRIQAYQTLHPVTETVVYRNQYTRAPQLVLTGDFPDTPGDVDYFIINDLTHFDIRNNPGMELKQPMGNRLHMQPGLSRSFIWPFFTITPRLQFAFTQYTLGDVSNGDPRSPRRALPIFDINSGFYFDRYVGFCNHSFRQTLEPKLYYVYIPYRNQTDLPVFDTTVNTLTYDQLFTYNRFSGYDRINDANRVAVGLTSRFIDQESGFEKIRMAIGEILYFSSRKVTLCDNPADPLCLNPSDIPSNPDNKRNRSPISALLNYAVDTDWSATANTIWNAQTHRLDNQSITLHYQPPSNVQKIVNLGYNFVRKGDYLPNTPFESSANNLSSTDFSFDWPISRDWSAMGRWTQNWNHHHFQNLLYGLQYDSCCWAVRFVTGRAFDGLNPSNTFKYNTQFYIQIALKGLGTVPIYGGDPAQLLTNNISGIQNTFGRDF